MSDHLHFPEHRDVIWWSDGIEPLDGPTPDAYVCVDCAWQGTAAEGYDHHRDSGHAIRGRHYPAAWPNVAFSDADCNGRRIIRSTDAA